MNSMFLTDFYKFSHRQQYPKSTEKVYSTFTPRTSRLPNINSVVVFGTQAFIKTHLIEGFNDNFFSRPKEDVVNEYNRLVKNTLGVQTPDSSHIEDLHDLGYLPIKIKALDEGTLAPIKTPILTIENTLPKFFWITNYIETLFSCEMWGPITSATMANEYRKLLEDAAIETVGDKSFVQFQGHDFSMRGMSSLASAQLSGMGHLTSFVGTDTVPSILSLEKLYNANIEKELVGTSVPATEHSIQCSYGNDLEYIKNMLSIHPTGIVSVVSDGYDFWNVLDNIVPSLKKEIMSRDGKLVIRPDCYDEQTKILTKDGWKFFKDLNENDLVAQVKSDNTYEFIKPLKVIKQYYSGDMYHFYDDKGKLDLLVTPNHKMIFNKDGKKIIQTAEKALVGEWSKRFNRSCESKDYNRELTNIERLKIAFQADGSFTTSGNKIRFSFQKERKIERLKNILDNENISYKIYNLKDGRVEFNINLHSDLFQKNFNWVNTSDLCSNWSKEFIEELSYWDASRRSENRFKFDTTIKEVIDKVELIALSAGYGVLLSEREDNRSDKFSNVFTAHILKDNRLGGQSQNKQKIENFSGNVYCVQVPSGEIIVKRNRCTLVCGNSGDPVKIICGDLDSDILSERKGAVEMLWDTFGGTVTDKGYKLLDSHIGLIYGDSITLERAKQIVNGLKEKGFASINVVLGIGSYTYQYNTRDTFGFAMKATACVINGEEKLIFKDPKTGDGTKKSQKGKVIVLKDTNGNITYKDNLSLSYEDPNDLLKEVFLNGKLVKETSLSEIRAKVRS